MTCPLLSSQRAGDPSMRLRTHHSRVDHRGRAEYPDDLVGNLTRGGSHIDGQRILVRLRLLKGIDLALEQTRRHEMAVAPRQTLGDQVSTTAKVDQPYFWPSADDGPAIGSLERGARDDARLLLGALAVDPGGHTLEPRLAVRIGQRNSGVHLGDVRRRMKRIALLERPAETRSQFSRDR